MLINNNNYNNYANLMKMTILKSNNNHLSRGILFSSTNDEVSETSA